MLLGAPALLLVAAALAPQFGPGAMESPRPQDPQVADLLRNAFDAAHYVNFELDRASAFQVVARAQAAAGDVAAARGTLLRARAAVAEQRTIEVAIPAPFLGVAADYLRVGDADGAAATFAQASRAAAAIRGAQYRALAHGAVAVRRRRAGDEAGATLDFTSALAAAAKDNTAFRDSTFCQLTAKMASVGRFAEAEAVVEGIKTDTDRSSAYREVLGGRRNVRSDAFRCQRFGGARVRVGTGHLVGQGFDPAQSARQVAAAGFDRRDHPVYGCPVVVIADYCRRCPRRIDIACFRRMTRVRKDARSPSQVSRDAKRRAFSGREDTLRSASRLTRGVGSAYGARMMLQAKAHILIHPSSFTRHP